MAGRDQDFITNARFHAKQLWNAVLALESMQSQWNALNYADTLPPGEGENVGLTKTEVGAVVFDSANAFRVVLDTGVATNLAKLL